MITFVWAPRLERYKSLENKTDEINKAIQKYESAIFKTQRLPENTEIAFFNIKYPEKNLYGVGTDTEILHYDIYEPE